MWKRWLVCVALRTAARRRVYHQHYCARFIDDPLMWHYEFLAKIRHKDAHLPTNRVYYEKILFIAAPGTISARLFPNSTPKSGRIGIRFCIWDQWKLTPKFVWANPV